MAFRHLSPPSECFDGKSDGKHSPRFCFEMILPVRRASGSAKTLQIMEISTVRIDAGLGNHRVLSRCRSVDTRLIQ